MPPASPGIALRHQDTSGANCTPGSQGPEKFGPTRSPRLALHRPLSRCGLSPTHAAGAAGPHQRPTPEPCPGQGCQGPEWTLGTAFPRASSGRPPLLPTQLSRGGGGSPGQLQSGGPGAPAAGTGGTSTSITPAGHWARPGSSLNTQSGRGAQRTLTGRPGPSCGKGAEALPPTQWAVSGRPQLQPSWPVPFGLRPPGPAAALRPGGPYLSLDRQVEGTFLERQQVAVVVACALGVHPHLEL